MKVTFIDYLAGAQQLVIAYYIFLIYPMFLGESRSC